MKRDQENFRVIAEMQQKVKDIKEMEESSFCALLMEMREQSKVLKELVQLIKSGAINSSQTERIIERVVESGSNAVDKSKTLYSSDSGSDFIPDVNTNGLKMSTKESEAKTAEVDLDTMPADMK